MRKILLLIVLFGVTITGVRAQVGIGTQDPHPAAQLEIKSSPEKRGLLIPRIQLTSIEMTLSGTTSKGQMPNSILVFNTGTFTATINGVAKGFGPGYYYWDVEAKGADGSLTKGAWVALLSGGSTKNIQNFFNTVNTNSSTVVYNSASNTFDLRVGNGLKNWADASGNKYVGLGGALTTDTTVDLGTFKLNVKGLQTSTVDTDEIVVIDQSSGELKVVKGISYKQIATENANNNKVLKTVNGKVEWVPITGTASNSIVQAENGLDISADGKVVLGGDLTKATKITATSSRTLAIDGLQEGAATSTLVVRDADGVLKYIDGVSTDQIKGGTENKGKILTVDPITGVVTWTSLGGSTTNTIDFSGLAGDGLVFNSTSGTLDVQAENGIKVEGDKVKLGGPLTGNTTITTAADKTLAIDGLQEGTATSTLVVRDADGVLKYIDGVSTDQIKGGTENKGKILTVDPITGVVTWTSLGGSTTNTIDFSGLAGDGLVFNSASGTLDVQAGNGITIEGDKVNWGGKLTKTATIETDDNKAFVIKPGGGTRTTSNVIIKDLPTGTVSDSFVVVDGDGNLKTVDPKSAAKIDYTDGPQETGRIWTVPPTGVGTYTRTVMEKTFLVDFGTGSTKVEVTNELGTDGNVTVIGIRLIGIDGNPNYINSNATYRYNYNPDNSGAVDTRDWIFIGTNQDAFSVTIKGKYFVIVEYFENN